MWDDTGTWCTMTCNRRHCAFYFWSIVYSAFCFWLRRQVWGDILIDVRVRCILLLVDVCLLAPCIIFLFGLQTLQRLRSFYDHCGEPLQSTTMPEASCILFWVDVCSLKISLHSTLSGTHTIRKTTSSLTRAVTDESELEARYRNQNLDTKKWFILCHFWFIFDSVILHRLWHARLQVLHLTSIKYICFNSSVSQKTFCVSSAIKVSNPDTIPHQI